MKAKALQLRALLTETLPFEVPLIFSNEGLHASLCVGASNPDIAALLKKLRAPPSSYSKPYSYEISKSDTRSTTLGIIHPKWQIEIANFYEKHSGTLLNFCSDDSFSLRRPADVASPFTEKEEEDDSRLKFGVVQQAVDDGEPDVSHMTSYFTYRKYNLLGKFVDSREYLRLEARFRWARTLDISKCFYHIYTHSVAWAVKNKSFAKKYSNKHAVEFELDAIMQRVNYNETNGIVVGPEFSRIFAEIILQRVDRDVRSDMDAAGHEVTKDYDIRRYVDDYMVFGNSEHVISCAEKLIRKHLEYYKLYINENKVIHLDRPFVSPLSLARQEVGALLRELSKHVAEIKGLDAANQGAAKIQGINTLLREIRMIVKKHGVGVESISGWLFSRLKKNVRVIFSYALKPEYQLVKDDLVDAAFAVLESAFHILALDLRVRQTYSLAQLATIFYERRSELSPEQVDTLDHIVMDGLTSLMRTARASGHLGSGSADSVESYNLLISGAHFLGQDFVRTNAFKEVISDILARPHVSYFAYITAKFCMLKDAALHVDGLNILNSRIKIHLTGAADIHLNAEDYLLLCDYVSAPDIASGDRRAVLAHTLGGNPSKLAADGVALHARFVDWDGLSVKHLLRRKTLRPVYAWA